MSDDILDPKNYLVNYSFECFRCNEKFNVHFAFIGNKDKISCPSCGQELNQEAFSSLKEAVENLKTALTLLNEHNSNVNGFGVSLFWNQINKLPNKPDKYLVNMNKKLLPKFEAFQAPISDDNLFR